ncbi:MAG TPA: hypothetical protein PLZ55_18875 [bacterium]|nr:hypothetical protein [bacterium]HPO10749.1 hypothetical protein [bacterium]HQP97638.1 hypothetical protein [bacterium]
MVGYLIRAIIEGLLFVAAVLFCAETINRLPRDISAIVNAVRERNKREIWRSLGEALFFWVVTVGLLWFFVIPETMKIFSGFASYSDFLKGFRM